MSRQLFDFSGLVRDFENEFTVSVPGEAHFDDLGDYVVDSSGSITMSGAIVAFKENKIVRSGGTITAQDRHLFMLEPIEKALIGATVSYGGDKYSIEALTENAEFTGIYSYILRRCSAFDTD